MLAEKPPKLNLFVLPSQTSLLFFIIAVVLGIPILLSGSRSSFLLLPVLPIGVALLTLWDFLRQPDIERRRWKMEELPEEHRWLAGWLDSLSRNVGLNQTPHILVAHGDLSSPFAFGTWRRHYLAFPAWLLPEMATAAGRSHSDDPVAVETILRHELAHFVNQDVWLASLARSLLKMTVVLFAASWFAMVWIPFTYEILRQMVSDWSTLFPTSLLALFPPDIQEFFSQPPALTGADVWVMETMFGIALWPLILGALLLWRTTWNSLLQTREHIADARVASWLHGAAAVGRAIKWFSIVQATSFVEVDLQSTSTGSLFALNTMPGFRRAKPLLAWPAALLERTRISPQPSSQARYATMAKPERVYGTTGAIGRQAGVAVLMLYLLMASIFAPIGEGINSEIAAGFGFVLLALGLTPNALVHGHDRQLLMCQVIRAVAIYALLFGVVVMVMLSVSALVLAWQPRSMDLTLYAIAMVAPRGNLQVIVDDPTAWLVQAFVGALVTFAVGLPVLVFAFVLGDLSLKRRVLTWYGAPWLQKRPKLFFLGITVTGAIVMWLGALPLLNLLAFPTIFKTSEAFWLRLAIALLLGMLSAIAIVVLHKRYAHRCPHCASQIPGSYTLGKHCPKCRYVLNQWLVASY